MTDGSLLITVGWALPNELQSAAKAPSCSTRCHILNASGLCVGVHSKPANRFCSRPNWTLTTSGCVLSGMSSYTGLSSRVSYLCDLSTRSEACCHIPGIIFATCKICVWSWQLICLCGSVMWTACRPLLGMSATYQSHCLWQQHIHCSIHGA